MVGGDACPCIGETLLTLKSGGMAIDRLAIGEGSLNLGLHLEVIGEHARVVHHLAKEADLLTLHERADVVAVEMGTGGLYRRIAGGHA